MTQLPGVLHLCPYMTPDNRRFNLLLVALVVPQEGAISQLSHFWFEIKNLDSSYASLYAAFNYRISIKINVR